MKPSLSRIPNPRVALFPLIGAALLLTGCSTRTIPAPDPVSVRLQGSVYGGQQPISGASIALYAAGTSGYGTPAASLLTSSVVTDASGGFNLTGRYTCAHCNDQVYLVARGGNAGSGPNNNIALMTALGNCGDLTPATFVSINEVTTVAAVYALANFMNPDSFDVSSDPIDASSLAIAFASARTLADPATGHALATAGVANLTRLNSLADSLATCINAVTSSGLCTNFYAAASASIGGPMPRETITALLYIAWDPFSNVSTIYNMASPTPPFLPALVNPPPDWTLVF